MIETTPPQFPFVLEIMRTGGAREHTRKGIHHCSKGCNRLMGRRLSNLWSVTRPKCGGYRLTAKVRCMWSPLNCSTPSIWPATEACRHVLTDDYRERGCPLARRFGLCWAVILGMKTSARSLNRVLNFRTCSMVRLRSPVMNMATALSDPN